MLVSFLKFIATAWAFRISNQGMAWEFWRFLIQVSLQRLRKRCQANFRSLERCRTFLAYLASSFRYQLSWISWNVSKGLACKASLQNFAWRCCKSSTRSPFSSGNNLDGVHFQARPLGWVHWSRFGGLQGSYQSASWANKDSESALIAVCVLPGAEFICIFLNSIIVTIYLFALRAIYAIHESEKETLVCETEVWATWLPVPVERWRVQAFRVRDWPSTPAYMCLYEFHKCIQISSNILITNDKLEVSHTLKQALKACK